MSSWRSLLTSTTRGEVQECLQKSSGSAWRQVFFCPNLTLECHFERLLLAYMWVDKEKTELKDALTVEAERRKVASGKKKRQWFLIDDGVEEVEQEGVQMEGPQQEAMELQVVEHEATEEVQVVE
jgi:hypothetical protein